MDDQLVSVFSEIFVVGVLVLLNGFFVAAEFAIVRSHPTKLRSSDAPKRPGTRASLKLIEQLDLSLSATQLGITLASLLLGWWGEQTFQKLFLQSLSWLNATVAIVISHALATAFALAVISFLHVVIGELAAKSLAIRFPETTLQMVARPMLFFCFLFRPIIYILNTSANLFLRLFGVEAPAQSERVHSLAELALLVSQSSEGGMLDKHEEELLKGVFGFSDTVAREVMTPRTDVVSIRINATFDEAVKVSVDSGLSRFPVVGERIDDVRGILVIRDLLAYVLPENIGRQREFAVQRIMREPYFIPGTKPVDDLLNEFKRRKVHLAIVLDEHGGVDGVVTLEDLIEEIVGDIFDESDVAENTVTVEESGDILLDGGVLVADLNTRFELQIPDGDYDTIAGFIFTCLGRLPMAGDRILIDLAGGFVVNPEEESLESEADIEEPNEPMEDEPSGDREDEDSPEAKRMMLLLTVEKVMGHRIETVRLHQFPRKDPSETESDNSASESPGGDSVKDISNG